MISPCLVSDVLLEQVATVSPQIGKQCLLFFVHRILHFPLVLVNEVAVVFAV